MRNFQRGWKDLQQEERDVWGEGIDPTWYLIGLVAIVLLVLFGAR